MIPRYYDGTTGLQGNGLGALRDCISCVVTEERNGSYELEMQYPITGQHYGSIALRGLICATPNPYADAQYFRIYKISRPINGQVTINAQHISYDLSGIPVKPFTAASATAALAGLKSNAADTCDFDFWTDKSVSSTFTVSVPSSLRSLLGGTEGSILDTYGGEYEWDNRTIKLHTHRGSDRGVTIRYGKNLTDLKQDENCASVYTGVYPYWTDSEGNLTQISNTPIVNVPDSTFDFSRILLLDLSEKFESAPTEAQLKSAALSYISANSIGVPKVNLTLSFAQLEQTEEYKGKALLERVSLCDTVHVSFSRLGVDATSKVIKTAYNVLLDRYDSVELGDARSSLANTVADIGKNVQETVNKTRSDLEKAIDRATQLITGNLGGYVMMHSSTGGDTPDEILVMDTDNINTAKKVWRWNLSGWGYSSTGYAGPYKLAATMDGAINADFITAGSLTANIIKAGILQDKTGKIFYLDLDNGILKLSGYSTTKEIDDKLGELPTKDDIKTEISAEVGKISLSVSEITETTNLIDGVGDDEVTVKAPTASGKSNYYNYQFPTSYCTFLKGQTLHIEVEYKVDVAIDRSKSDSSEADSGFYISAIWAPSNFGSAVAISLASRKNNTSTPAGDWTTATADFVLPDAGIAACQIGCTLRTGTGKIQVKRPKITIGGIKRSQLTLTQDGTTISTSTVDTSGEVSAKDFAEFKVGYNQVIATVVKEGEIRSKFAMDTSSVTISSGVITFSGNTLVVDSDNFKLEPDGTVSISGSLTSQVGSSRAYIGEGIVQMSTKNDNDEWKETIRLWSDGSAAPMGHITLYGNNPDGKKEERLELQAENGGGRIYVYNSNGKAIFSLYPQSDGTGKLVVGGDNDDTGTISAPKLETKYGLYVNGYLFHPEKVNYKNGGGTSVEQWFLAIKNSEPHPS